MKRPDNLQEKAHIRIVAPCGLFDRSYFDNGLNLLKNAGFTTVFDDSLFSAYRYFAGSDERRLTEMNTALADTSTQAIWVARGGYGATRIVDQISVEQVRAANKWLIGFSDVTALHALWARAGIQSIHGANITTLDSWGPEARAELYASLKSPTRQSFDGKLHRGEGNAQGRVLGGNLAVLTAMLGTGQLPDFRGSIVLLEDIGERPYKLDRMLTQHRLAKTFEGAAGFVIGQLSGCEPGDGHDYTAADVVAENLSHHGVPVMHSVPLGHDGNSRAIVFGAVGEIDVKLSKFTIDPDAGQGGLG